jgi:hypothetical protein
MQGFTKEVGWWVKNRAGKAGSSSCVDSSRAVLGRMKGRDREGTEQSCVEFFRTVVSVRSILSPIIKQSLDLDACSLTTTCESIGHTLGKRNGLGCQCKRQKRKIYVYILSQSRYSKGPSWNKLSTVKTPTRFTTVASEAGAGPPCCR